MIPDCPGYLVERRLADTGRLWAARDVRSGARVTLLLPGAGERLADVEHPHVAAVREVVDAGGAVVVVLDVADARTLGSLLGRAALPAGEVLTALGPLVGALGWVHAAGTVHGAVDAAGVLIDRAGRPWLLPVRGGSSTGAAQAPDDVRALTRLALRALAGRDVDVDDAGPAPAGVDVEAWAQLLAVAGPTGPGRSAADLAADLAAALAALGPPTAVRSGRPAGLVDRPPPRRSRRPRRDGRPPRGPFGAPGARGDRLGSARARAASTARLAVRPVPRRERRLLAVLAAVAGLTVTLVVGARLATGEAPAPVDGAAPRLDLTDPAVVCAPTTATPAASQAPTPDPTPGEPRPAGAQGRAAGEPTDWAVTVRELYGRRATALEHGDPAALCAVYAAGSPGLVADLELLAAYASAGVRPSALRFDVLRVGDVTRSADVVDLAVTDRLAGYDLVAADGTVRGTRPALTERTWRARLVADAGRWVFG